MAVTVSPLAWMEEEDDSRRWKFRFHNAASFIGMAPFSWWSSSLGWYNSCTNNVGKVAVSPWLWHSSGDDTTELESIVGLAVLPVFGPYGTWWWFSRENDGFSLGGCGCKSDNVKSTVSPTANSNGEINCCWYECGSSHIVISPWVGMLPLFNMVSVFSSENIVNVSWFWLSSRRLVFVLEIILVGIGVGLEFGSSFSQNIVKVLVPVVLVVVDTTGGSVYSSYMVNCMGGTPFSSMRGSTGRGVSWSSSWNISNVTPDDTWLSLVGKDGGTFECGGGGSTGLANIKDNSRKANWVLMVGSLGTLPCDCFPTSTTTWLGCFSPNRSGSSSSL